MLHMKIKSNNLITVKLLYDIKTYVSIPNYMKI